MNRSNTSANKDIGHIVKDMLRLLVAYGVAVLFMGRAWSLRTLGGMTGLAAIFVLLYVLGKEEQYLYNVTLFGYPDRIQRRRTGSFLVATAATVVLLPYITEDQRGYFLFICIAGSPCHPFCRSRKTDTDSGQSTRQRRKICSRRNENHSVCRAFR